MSSNRRTFLSASGLALLSGAGSGAFSEIGFAAQAAAILPAVAGPDWVLINGNENPLGPCPAALEAVAQAAKVAGRYSPHFTAAFVKTAAELHGVPADHVMPFPGSGDPLMRTVMAFGGKNKGLVLADPGYEAGVRAANKMGFPVKLVPLAKDHSHDVEAMVKADPNAGVIYICNPNNPTGTMTPRSKIEWALANKPKGSVLLLDEAYIHFSDGEPCHDLVTKGGDLILIRTFSKIYGMAGLRAGMAMGRPELLAKLQNLGSSWMPITGMAAAHASLKDKALVPERKRINSEIREMVFEHMERKHYKYVPSQSNKYMVDTGRPADTARTQLEKYTVMVARTFPAWPNHIRVTIGTREEMKKFLTAFDAIMNA